MRDFLRQADPMLRQLFDGISEGVLVVDLDGKPVFWNTAAQRILGLEVLEGPPGAWMDRGGVFSADGTTPLPRAERPLPRAMRGEQVTNEEFVIRRDEGDACLLSCTARPLCNAAGTLVGGVSTFRDITELRKVENRLQTSERRYRTLAPHLPSSVVLLFDRSLHFTLAEGGGWRLWGSRQARSKIGRLRTMPPQASCPPTAPCSMAVARTPWSNATVAPTAFSFYRFATSTITSRRASW